MQLFQQGLLFTNDQKGPVHLIIMLHYWANKGPTGGKCPSSYIVKKCPASSSHIVKTQLFLTALIVINIVKFNFEKNDSDINFILLQRRFDASCIIFNLKIK
jgi:hypothetical protein